MTWHVQYRQAATEHVDRHPSPERAIEAACRLIDDGHDVFGIGKSKAVGQAIRRLRHDPAAGQLQP
jgi:hypothetical protein